MLLLFGSTTCRKPQQSVEFDHASRAFSSLYAQELDDAYLDPRTADIEAELSRVNPKSVDAPAANELRTRMANGRAAQLKIQSDREAASAAARSAAPDQSFSTRAPAPPPQAPPAREDAGAPDQPSAGMALADFNHRFGDCFAAAGPLNVVGQGMRDSYALRDLMVCRQQHPGFESLLVVADGRTLLGVFPKSAIFNAATADGGQRP